MIEDITIRPQPGPQEKFLSSPADIVIYGGAAGGGKSFALILEALRYVHVPNFGGVIFRRTSPELTGPGSLWEEARQVYPHLGGTMRESPNLDVTFPSGAMLQFLHLQHPKDVYAHQGKQYAFVGFDELTLFEESQFWYIMSRLRSASGVKPYMRCTTNPDPDSFVRDIIDWWIGEDGTPIEERSGVVRYFVRVNDSLFWANNANELTEQFGSSEDIRPRSLTFIHARLSDNPILTRVNPDYKAQLLSLREVERERLLNGNWDVREAAGKYIKAEFFEERWEKHAPDTRVYIASDYAVTDSAGARDPDYTEHGVFGYAHDGKLYVLDWWFGQTTSDVWIERLLDLIDKWKPLAVFGESGQIRRAVEPFLKRRQIERKSWCRLEWLPSATDKAIRGRPFQAMAASKRIVFPKTSWADRVVQQCVAFDPNKKTRRLKDDAFDAMSKMCQAIDVAHPAIVEESTPKITRDKSYTSMYRSEGPSWKTL